MPQPKDQNWLNGYKNKTPTYVVYKRPTSKKKVFTTAPLVSGLKSDTEETSKQKKLKQKEPPWK